MTRRMMVIGLLSFGLMALALVRCGSTTANPICESDFCSGHGLCVEFDGVPSCSCQDGYTGERCQYCDNGYHLEGTDCVADNGCLSTTCSGHGTCDATSGAPVCTCDTGYAGPDCSSCADGYHGDNGVCMPDSGSCQSDTCTGHGTCDDSSGNPVCTCDAGYEGGDCSLCASGYHDDAGSCVPDGQTCDENSCSGHGSCDDSSGSPVCTCDTGFGGTDCSSCSAGYHDENGNCVADQTCQADSCSGHGTCSDDAGTIDCTCDAGFSGENCSACAPGFHDENGDCVADPTCGPNTCNGHGACDDSSGSPSCTCDEAYEGDNCADCAAGYVPWDDNGTSICVDDLCAPDPCTISHGISGTCIQVAADAYTCTCVAGYAWANNMCNLSCLDVDGDQYGNGPDCLGTDCDDGDASIHNFAVELCDNKDNDCDFSTDEDFPLRGQPCDGGDQDQCQNGTYTCKADGTDVECVNENPTDLFEVCNGQDDDCDGSTDEDFPVGQACDGGDSDQCKNGTFTCSANGQTVECLNENPINIQEVCDGLDNDCDLSFDEGFPDLDGDGSADCVDPDDDGDGADDDVDNCAIVYNPGQEDEDNDGLGDYCDPTPFNCADHAGMYNDDPASVTVLGSGGTQQDCSDALYAWNPPGLSCNVTCIFSYFVETTYSVDGTQVNSYTCCYGDYEYTPCHSCDQAGCEAAYPDCDALQPFHSPTRSADVMMDQRQVMTLP